MDKRQQMGEDDRLVLQWLEENPEGGSSSKIGSALWPLWSFIENAASANRAHKALNRLSRRKLVQRKNRWSYRPGSRSVTVIWTLRPNYRRDHEREQR